MKNFQLTTRITLVNLFRNYILIISDVFLIVLICWINTGNPDSHPYRYEKWTNEETTTYL